ncbi:MAG: hypothetical protein ACOCUU_03635 [Nanoarchaeota archaeon]
MEHEEIQQMISEKRRALEEHYLGESDSEEDYSGLEKQQANLLSKLSLTREFDILSRLQLRVSSNTNFLTQCSLCNRYKTSDERYVELSKEDLSVIERLARDRNIPLEISHGICEPCYEKHYCF